MSKLVMFIHGIGSDSNAWKKYIDIVKSDIDFSDDFELYVDNITNIDNNKTYYTLWDYESKLISIEKYEQCKAIFTGNKGIGSLTIDNISNTLKYFLQSMNSKFNELIIVAHSMGGLLSLNVLLDTIKNDNKLKISKCILYGTPIEGSDNPTLLETVFPSLPSELLMELEKESNTISSLKQKIQRYDIKNEYDIVYIHGDKDARIIECENYCKRYIGDFIQIAGDHSSIIQPKDISMQSFTIFKELFMLNNDISQNKITVIIPAGGEGGTLFPITQVLPKTLVTVGTKSLLQHIVNSLFEYKNIFEKVIVMTGEKYSKAIQENISQGNYGDFVECVRGEGRTLPEALIKIKETFLNKTVLIHYNDILIEKCDWKDVMERYDSNKKRHQHMGMLLVSKNYPAPLGIGIVKEGENDIVDTFKEKPKSLVGDNFANMGVGIFEPKLFDYMKENHNALYEDTMDTILNNRETISLYKIDKWHHIQDLKALYFMQNEADLSFLDK